MAAPKRNVGLEILEGLRQLKRGEHGRVTTVPSVATIREGTGLSQPRFAQLLGVSVRTLQEWGAGPAGALWRRTNAADHCGQEPTRAHRGCVTRPRLRAQRHWLHLDGVDKTHARSSAVKTTVEASPLDGSPGEGLTSRTFRRRQRHNSARCGASDGPHLGHRRSGSSPSASIPNY